MGCIILTKPLASTVQSSQVAVKVLRLVSVILTDFQVVTSRLVEGLRTQKEHPPEEVG